TDRWERLLDELCERSWCMPAKRDALLGFTGVVRPAPERPWPATYLRDELLRGQQAFSQFEKRVNHVKLTLQHDGTVDATAYFGFAPQRGAHDAEAGDRPSTASRRRRPASVDPAARAAEFLAGARTEAGWWRDFGSEDVPAGRRAFAWSDEWVTAYTG